MEHGLKGSDTEHRAQQSSFCTPSVFQKPLCLSSVPASLHYTAGAILTPFTETRLRSSTMKEYILVKGQ